MPKESRYFVGTRLPEVHFTLQLLGKDFADNIRRVLTKSFFNIKEPLVDFLIMPIIVNHESREAVLNKY